MKIEPTFLKSKVARRMFSLFVLCALVPISALAVISFSHVTKELERQSQRRLQQSCKALGLSIFERLLFLEQQLEVLSPSLNMGSEFSTESVSVGSSEHLKKRFKGLAIVADSGKCIPVFGDIQNPTSLSEEEKKHLRAGKTVVLTRPTQGDRLGIYMVRAVDLQGPRQEMLFGEIEAVYLWGLAENNTLPRMTELCVLDESNNLIYSTLPLPSSVAKKVALEVADFSLGQFEWKYEDERYLAGFWSIPLKFKFFYPKWTVVLSASKHYISAPMAYFKKMFFLVMLLSIWVVLFISIIQIRKTMLPLEKLKHGTERIAGSDFKSRVTFKSGDEFEELGASFNDMARRLGRQFAALTTMAEIDRAVLSALDIEKIVNTAITRMGDVLSCDAVSFTLFDSKDQKQARTYIGVGQRGTLKSVEAVEISQEEIQKLAEDWDALLINEQELIPSYLEPLAKTGTKSFVVLPLFLTRRLVGIIALGSTDSSAPSQEDLRHVRQVADQVAVALSNAQLLQDLNRLNLGTLRALARAVDAKSPWTAGHSERVTEKAIKIGQVLGLSGSELEDLHRGGLLHDIGKIGVPAALLDKPGRLTDEEYGIIKQHPGIGARILEPIAAYDHIIPMVLQHHERFDGKGYPEGLSGEGIPLSARILAVADAYDAMVSDRPYRNGMDVSQAIRVIGQEAGRQFDPNVVEAFLEVIKQEKKELRGREKKEAQHYSSKVPT